MRNLEMKFIWKRSKKEELNNLLCWFYAQVQPKEKETKKQEYHNRYLSDIGRHVDIVHHQTFK